MFPVARFSQMLIDIGVFHDVTKKKSMARYLGSLGSLGSLAFFKLTCILQEHAGTIHP